MQPSSHPLPIKWYIASFVGSLALACALMTVFEIRTGINPKVASSQPAPPVSDSHIASTTNPVPEQATPPPPTTPPPVPPSQVKPTPPPSLWSLLAPPEVEYGAMILVGLGAIGISSYLIRQKLRSLK